MVTKKYYEEINCMKGMAAVLVVLGHAIKQTGVTNPVFDVLFTVIYSFHMPLFFFAAGFVGVKILRLEGNGQRLEYAKERFLRLMVPYFTVSILYTPFKYILSAYANDPYDFSSAWRIFIGESPDGGLWFLYVLFVISVVCGLFVSQRNLLPVLAVSFVLAIAGNLVVWPVNLGYQLTRNFFFFVLGLYVRTKYETWQDKLYQGSVLAAALVIFIAGNWLNLQGVVFFGAMAGWRYLVTVSDLLTAAGGIVLSLHAAKAIACAKPGIASVGKLLGDYCMDIYILAEPIKVGVKILFWSFLGWNYILCTLLCFGISLFAAIVLSKYILRRFRLFRFFILGMPG